MEKLTLAAGSLQAGLDVILQGSRAWRRRRPRHGAWQRERVHFPSPDALGTTTLGTTNASREGGQK